jgi:hypothetical protein
VPQNVDRIEESKRDMTGYHCFLCFWRDGESGRTYENKVRGQGQSSYQLAGAGYLFKPRLFSLCVNQTILATTLKSHAIFEGGGGGGDFDFISWTSGRSVLFTSLR